MNTGLMALYLGFLCVALLAPFVSGTKQMSGRGGTMVKYLPLVSAFAIALFLFVGRNGLLFPLTPLLLLAFLQRGLWALAGCAALMVLFAPVPWWNTNLISLPYGQWAVFAALVAGTVAASRSALASISSVASAVPMRWEHAAGFCISTAAALGIGLYTPALTQYFPTYIAWHHWGAYLSPVEALLSGGVPFYDFPVQYGIGPTLLIAAVCSSSCWAAMFDIVLVANALYCGVLVVCALVLTAGHSRILKAIAAVAVFVAAILWTAFPSDFGTALATPSVAGLRFLPLVCQLLFILYAEKNPRLPMMIGHTIWGFNLFWSVEAAAFASVLWWSWLTLRAVRSHPAGNRFLLIVRHLVMSIAATAIGMSVLLGLFWLSFGILPEISSVIAYLQNPPGAVPANFAGPVWLAVVLAVMAIATLMRGTPDRNGPLFACLIAMIMSFSYYLSRAHDNNVLNLFPFLVLVALCLLPAAGQKQAGPESEFQLGFCLAFLMSVIVFVASFNLWVWDKVISSGNITQVGAGPLIRQISADGIYAEPVISRDAAALLAEVRKQGDAAPLMFDDAALMPSSKSGSGWTSVNNVANYAPLPDALVSRYIGRSAARYRRAGWIIIDKSKYGKWTKLFSASYVVSDVRQRGKYAAYLMTPKTLSAVP